MPPNKNLSSPPHVLFMCQRTKLNDVYMCPCDALYVVRMITKLYICNAVKMVLQYNNNLPYAVIILCMEF